MQAGSCPRGREGFLEPEPRTAPRRQETLRSCPAAVLPSAPPGKPATRLGGSSRQLPGGPSGATDPCGPSTVKPNRRGSNPDEAQACDSLSPSRSSPRRGAGVWEPHRVVIGRGPDPLCRHFTFARFVSVWARPVLRGRLSCKVSARGVTGGLRGAPTASSCVFLSSGAGHGGPPTFPSRKQLMSSNSFEEGRKDTHMDSVGPPHPRLPCFWGEEWGWGRKRVLPRFPTSPPARNVSSLV